MLYKPQFCSRSFNTCQMCFLVKALHQFNPKYCTLLIMHIICVAMNYTTYVLQTPVLLKFLRYVAPANAFPVITILDIIRY